MTLPKLKIVTSTRIGILSHVDLDGVASALLVKEAAFWLTDGYGDRPTVDAKFIGYSKGIGERLRDFFDGAGYDYGFITDISLRDEDIDIFAEVARKNPGTQFFWFDHHISSQPNRMPADLDNVFVCVEQREGVYKCGADVCWDILWVAYCLIGEPTNERDTADHARYMRDLAHDYDITKPDGEWRKDLPQSVDLSDAISELGPTKVYKIFAETGLLIEEWEDRPEIWEAIQKARKSRQRSLELVSATKRSVYIGNQKINVAACLGHSSEAGQFLADGDTEVAAVVLDLDSHESTGGTFQPGLSLRRANHSEVNLKVLAEKLGGGGHPFAAGGRINPERLISVMLNEVETYLKERLS